MESVILNGYEVIQNRVCPDIADITLYGVYNDGDKPIYITQDIQKVVEFCYKKEGVN